MGYYAPTIKLPQKQDSFKVPALNFSDKKVNFIGCGNHSISTIGFF